MRITNKMITTSYARSLNTLNADLNKLSNQVTTGRKFAKSSEDTAAAVKAFQIRRNMSRAEDYMENILHAKDFLSNSESVLSLVQDSVQNALEKVRMGLNGTQSITERKILAQELKTIQEEMLQTLNSNSTGIFVFGGSNTISQPFGLDANGSLTYNGFVLKDLDPESPDPIVTDTIAALKADGLTADIGLGLTVTGADIDPTSVFTYSIPGIAIMANGSTSVDGEEISNNLYDQLGAIAAELEKDDGDFSFDRLSALFGKLEDSAGIILFNITNIGAKTSYLDFMEDRYDTQIINMKERQVHVEGVDTALTIISFETQKVAYLAALQMGTNIIQKSIFDFLS